MTEAEYLASLEACNWSDPAVSELVSSTYTNVMFNNKVMEMQVNNPLGAFNFFGGFFGSEVWADGQGDDQIREYSTDPYIPFSFSHFTKQSPVCNPNLANACDFDFCEVPEGGKGTFPGMQWVKWGFETKRSCIANIRSIRDFQYWAAKAIRFRQLIDEQVMNMFYVMVAIKTLGHKITLNGNRNGGLLSLVTNSNPRNISGYGSYNYMQERFPEITDVNNLMPIDWHMLERIARRWTRHPSAEASRVGTGPRGENIYEMWHPDDIYAEEVYRNPDYMKSLRYTMPSSQFAGYSLSPGEQEIIGNWKFKVMPWLPRFAPTADGRIVPVDSHIDVPIEVGNEPVPNPNFEDAPIGLAMIISGKMGTILTRPTLTQSGDGAPILPIASSEPWQINNHYDPVCNKLLNKPFFFKRYEMGWRLDNPNAGMGFLFRRRVFSPTPITDCDLAPVFITEDNQIDCPFTTIGCAPKSRETDDITQPDNAPKLVECFTAECGNTGSPWRYNIKVKRIANQPDYNSLGCACGSNVTLHIYNNDQPLTPVRQQQGILKSDIKGFPYGIYVVSTTTQVGANECIRYITCADSTPLQANVVTSWDQTDNPDYDEGLGFVLDGPMGCDSQGDDVKVRYYNAQGVVLQTVDATIAEIDIEGNMYRVTSVSPNLKSLKTAMDTTLPTVAYLGVSCNESPNVSSSSSGD